METKERILQGADELFRQYGIRSITMDDIARHLSISKKTIYRFFPDKDHIVKENIRFSMDVVVQDLDKIQKNAKDAVQEILHILDYLNALFIHLNPAIFYDLQKHHPVAWKMFNEFQVKHLMKSIVDNLQWGMKEGVYRKDINLSIVAHLRLDQAMRQLDPRVFPETQFSLAEVHSQSLKLYLYGICTLKGIKLIEKYNTNKLSKKQKV